ELRAPLHHSVPPSAECVNAQNLAAALQGTGERIAGFHAHLLEALAGALASYLERTDRLIDEPTVVIIEGAQREIALMRTESERLLAEFPALRVRSRES